MMMTKNMTFFTNRQNIKPVLRFIAGMMVFFCLFGAVMAFQGVGEGQGAGFDGIFHSINCLAPLWMIPIILLCGLSSRSFTFFALVVSFGTLLTLFALVVTFLAGPSLFALFVTFTGSLTFVGLKIPLFGELALFALPITFLLYLKFFGLLIYFLCFFDTSFTLAMKPVFIPTILIKLRKGLNFVASGTSFCYYLLSHLILSLIKNYLVRAGCWHLPAVGSLYYSKQVSLFNINIKPI